VTDATWAERAAPTALLDTLERFYDAVPRAGAVAEDHGPLTLFVRRDQAGHPYYARPTLGHPGPATVDDVGAVRARQRTLGEPEAFEWVHDTSPWLTSTVEDTGLAVRRCPLLVLSGAPIRPPLPAGVELVAIGPDDDDELVAAVDVVPGIAFEAGGTAAGVAGTAERDAQVAALDRAALDRRRAGLGGAGAVRVAAVGRTGPLTGALCVGTFQHAVGVAEIVGVGALPAARRRGLGAAVTAALAVRALADGLHPVFLSAGSDEVARVYERVGFARIATACIAEPVSS